MDRLEVGFVARHKRRLARTRAPDEMTRLKVEWIRWLVERYGRDAVGCWDDAPVSFERWLSGRRRNPA